jgi:hypothetical protein
VAGHALSHNYGSTGVALLGTFTKRGEGGKPGFPPSPAMKDSLVELLVWDCERHDVDPEGASNFLRSDDGWNRELANVPGHRDCNPTICPGGHIYDLLPSLRSEVATALARTTPGVSLSTPAEDTVPLSEAGGLQYTWDGSTEEFSYLLEGWRRKPSSEDIDYLAGFDLDPDSSRYHYPAWTATTLKSATLGELFGTFGVSEQLSAGHYTLHVRAVDEGGSPSYQGDHTLLVTDDGGSGDPGGSFTLTATGYKVKGLQKADLAWSGAPSAAFDIFRDGAPAPIATVTNGPDGEGAYTDPIDRRGGGSYSYRVCEVADTSICSNVATVTF